MLRMRQEYGDEDVHEILKRAVRVDSERQTGKEALRQAALELGISDEALAQAELEYARERGHKVEVEEYLRETRRGYWEHLTSYVIVNSFLVAINLLTSSSHFWAIYPILGWGIGLAFHTAEAFQKPTGTSFERDFARWRRRKKRRERALEADLAEED
jgi:hypothetical protein